MKDGPRDQSEGSLKGRTRREPEGNEVIPVKPDGHSLLTTTWVQNPPPGYPDWLVYHSTAAAIVRRCALMIPQQYSLCFSLKHLSVKSSLCCVMCEQKNTVNMFGYSRGFYK